MSKQEEDIHPNLLMISLPCSRCKNLTNITFDNPQELRIECKYFQYGGKYHEVINKTRGCPKYEEDIDILRGCLQ